MGAGDRSRPRSTRLAACRAWFSEARHLQVLHLGFAIAWLFPGVVLAWFITYRLPDPHAAYAILVVSLWANFVSHLGAYGAARAEQSSEPSGISPELQLEIRLLLQALERERIARGELE